MKPILFELGGFTVTSYGVSKALAALAAGFILARELRRYGRDPEHAWSLTLWAAIGGFAGAKLYYLVENLGSLSVHDLGGHGFTWFGGLIGGATAVTIVSRSKGIPVALMAGMAAVPLSVGYGIGRLGCLLAGDGTYGTPTDLPWGMSFPDGTVPTLAEVHPTPLYEALAAFAVAALLWQLRTRVRPEALFALFAVLHGAFRFLVEFVRLNEEVAVGLTQPQLWSLALLAFGMGLGYRILRSGGGRPPRPATAG